MLSVLEEHSFVKLEILRDYIVSYIQILCQRHLRFQEGVFKITIVDGFAGGGMYDEEKEGSPFFLLRAVRGAEAILNRPFKDIKIKILADFFFIEEDKAACKCLLHHLSKSEFKSEINRSINVIHGKFQEHYHKVIDHSKGKYKRGKSRVIFFLDQCGYSNVSPFIIREISQQLNFGAEFIINFSIDFFLTFVGDSEQFKKLFEDFNLNNYIDLDEIVRIKENKSVDWRYLIEGKFGEAYQLASASKCITPFYIQPYKRNRGYWLLHLSSHSRARLAMTDVFWKNANSRHFGGKGLDMLSYKAEAPDYKYNYLDGMGLSDLETKNESKAALLDDIPREIWKKHTDGISIKDFMSKYCTESIANTPLWDETFKELMRSNDVQIKGARGGKKRSQNISEYDIISPNTQRYFNLMC